VPPSRSKPRRAPPAPAPVKAVPVLKERIEEYQVPVVLKETKSLPTGCGPDNRAFLVSGLHPPALEHHTQAFHPEPIRQEDNYTYTEAWSGLTFQLRSRWCCPEPSTFVLRFRGQLVRETVADGKGVVQSVSEWTWVDGRKSEWKVLDAKGLVLAKTTVPVQGWTAGRNC
jgi:hypothetical protein